VNSAGSPDESICAPVLPFWLQSDAGGSDAGADKCCQYSIKHTANDPQSAALIVNSQSTLSV